MPRPSPGEIWLADLGYAAKTRPVLLLSRYPGDDELALVLIVPHTTAVRHNRWEFNADLAFLKQGVFHLQQVQPVSLPKLIQRLGFMPPLQLSALRHKLATELELI